MEINPTGRPQTATAQNVPTRPSAWRVGQVFSAVALQDSVQGSTLLRIGSVTVSAQAPLKLTAGEKLQLEVIKSGTIPVLQKTQLVNSAKPSILDAAIKDVLPKQQGLATILNTLSKLSIVESKVPVLSSVQQLASQLVERLVQSQHITKTGLLENAVKNSGIFLESKLAGISGHPQAKNPLDGDLKAALLRLRDSLQKVNPQENLPNAATRGKTNIAITSKSGGFESTQSSNSAINTGKSGKTGIDPRSSQVPITTQAGSTKSDGKTLQSPTLSNQRSNQSILHSTNVGPLKTFTSAEKARTPPSISTNPNSTLAKSQSQNTQQAIPAPVSKVVIKTALSNTSTPFASSTEGSTSSTRISTSTQVSQSTKQLLQADLSPPPLRGNAPQPQGRSVGISLADMDPQQFNLRLLKLVESSIARVQLSQLASHSSDIEQKSSLILDLPIRNGESVDIFQLLIEPEDEGNASKGKGSGRRGWNISLAFDLPELGPLNIVIRLFKDQVSATFWTDREDTAELIRSHLPDLQNSLDQAGLIPSHLVCVNGKPNQTSDPKTSNRLLDEKA